ncbi:hypothetical protein NVV78_04035 [Pediococcus ethanolidurans]|uniref:lectin-like domain-containing protein n=1 Tax=Pediococcus ethanolidurans TaxID=319653 RepID=UPI001C1EF017|nr:hypothetical protein [Pediococcus ethanolidurans]MBU7555396.1 hypothetical protein [Pediococcus ethanolidurans]MBU7563291.1 hypothetical protein [Pediococcus ethanolidurans]MCT4397122.1 hypothetical protein [Pediococcus ethanolidurans]MCV3315117.1 hypothetical protein [Pediococcus ethanolidurans]MCV3320742.1 hypothetical protein [Pediococcus ethanolidurans]
MAVASFTSSQKSLVTPISSETGSDQNSTASNSQRIAKSLVRKTSARIATVVVASGATIDTGTLNGTNPAGADAATSTINTADEVTDSFETTGSASTDTNGKVTLTNGAEQNGSYVFDNQVDTTKGFTLTGS